MFVVSASAASPAAMVAAAAATFSPESNLSVAASIGAQAPCTCFSDFITTECVSPEGMPRAGIAAFQARRGSCRSRVARFPSCSRARSTLMPAFRLAACALICCPAS
jgi:hypothetical protein